MKVVFCAINAKFIHSSLAAYALRAFVGREKIKIIEGSVNDSIQSVMRRLVKEEADVYLFSVLIFNVEYVKKIMSDIKAVRPGSILIVGGPEVTFDTEVFMRENPAVDIVVRGEGEKPLRDLLVALESGAPLEEIKNMVYRNREDICRTQQCAEHMDMEALPFPYKEEDLAGLDNKIIYYETSRGCPYRCAYCMAAVEPFVRHKSVEKIKKELDFFMTNRVAIVKLTDRTFNCDAKRANEIWRYIKENNISTLFHFEIAADLLDEEQIALLKSMPRGYIQLEAGIQSADEKTLRAIGRKSDLKKAAENLKRLVQNENIHVHTDLIVGLPYETYESVKKSFNFAYDIGADMLQLGFLKILKGAPIIQRLQEDAYRYSAYAPYEVLSNRWLTYTDICKLKNIEAIVDQYANSRRFVQTLQYVIASCYQGDSFALFEALAEYFEESGYFDEPVAKERLYGILIDFLKTHSAHNEHTRAALAYDSFVSGINPNNSELVGVAHNKFELLEALRKLDIFTEEQQKLPDKKLVKKFESLILDINPINHTEKQVKIVRIKQEKKEKCFKNFSLLPRVYFLD